MSRQRQTIVIIALALLTTVSGLWASEPGVRSQPPASPAAVATTAWGSAAQVWRALMGFWLPLARPADSAGRDRRGGWPHCLTATCDEGTSLDPNGRCVKNAVLHPMCDSGTSIDPDGRCVKNPVLHPTCDSGTSLDPDGRCGH